MKKVFINPGHAPGGNPDPGAVGPTGLRESDVAAAGGFAVWQYFPRVVATTPPIAQKEEKFAEIPVQALAETKIRYVERTAGDRAQVKIETEAPEVIARINGQDFTFDSVAGEKHAFEKGQLVVRQESAATIDLTAWANRELAAQKEELKKEFYKPRGVVLAALAGAKQGYAGIEYENKAFVIGAYRGLSGKGDKHLLKVGWRWRF
ncbi:MAG: hypothetical protein LBO03_00610 [Acidaminococcales bacterium]|jgi:hypothetical protein|nr:hypothetical protein [Acidaminococcales bacterium]